MFGLFKNPLWGWLVKRNQPAWTIVNDEWEDYNRILSRREFNDWFQKHSILVLPTDQWPEDYHTFATQLRVPYEHFRMGRVRKIDDQFQVFGINHDRDWVEPSSAYERKDGTWEEVPLPGAI